MSLFGAVRKQGRPARPIDAEVLRELTPEDLAQLDEARGEAPPSELMRIRDRHHALARALASGMTEKDAGIITGYMPARISVLKADPSFQQLLEFYRSHTDDAYRDMHERMASLGIDAVDELHNRLEEAPTDFSNEQLLDIGKTFADRTGYGPSTKTTNVNINVTLAERLEAARKRTEKVIEHGPRPDRPANLVDSSFDGCVSQPTFVDLGDG